MAEMDTLNGLFIAQYTLLIVLHLFFAFRSKYGRDYYISDGYVLILVATIILGAVVHGWAFATHPCANAVGYCGTISCVSGNIYFQGYVYMFVIFMVNAYIYLRALAFYPSDYTDDQKEDDSYHDMLADDAPREHPRPKKVREAWPCYDIYSKTFCPWRNNCSSEVAENCGLNHILRDIVRVGLICTTFTGILPTIAYDDPKEASFLLLFEASHLVGIIGGCGLILVGLVSRTFCRCCNDIRGKDKSEYPSERIFTRMEYAVDFLIICISITLIFIFGNYRQTTDIPAAHFCLQYKTPDSCNALDRDLPDILKPWPCVWNSTELSTAYLCTNPTCDWQTHAIGITTEYFLLSYIMLLLASFVTSIRGVYAPRPARCTCCGAD